MKAGKARYIGASSMYAWQFCKALDLPKQHGWTRFVSMQNHYNLLYREEEREMMPLCADEGDRRHSVEPARARPPDARLGREQLSQGDRRVRRSRSTRGPPTRTAWSSSGSPRSRRSAALPRAQIALAWMLQKSFVTAPIIGASKPNHLDDAVASLSVNLTAEEMEFLEEPYVPHAVTGVE